MVVLMPHGTLKKMIAGKHTFRMCSSDVRKTSQAAAAGLYLFTFRFHKVPDFADEPIRRHRELFDRSVRDREEAVSWLCGTD